MKFYDLKNKCKVILFTFGLLVIVVFLLNGCSSEEKSGDSTEKESIAEMQKSTVKKKGAGKSSKTFEEFISKKKDIAIQIYPLQPDGIFDIKEAIELYVEIYNPRYIATQVYEKRLSEEQSKPQFVDLSIGSDQHSWKENLTLFNVIDSKETPVSFIYVSDTNKRKLNVGQGDIGSMSILIPPDELMTVGVHNLQLKYTERDKSRELAAQTQVSLKRDHLNKLQIEISNINYLLTAGKRQKALNQLLKLVKTSPESFHARALLGQVYEENGKIQKAISTYKSSLLLFKVDEDKNYVPEYPVGIWKRIQKLEAKLDE
jgi:tetratricopeptide (TPR) repeat protein